MALASRLPFWCIKSNSVQGFSEYIDYVLIVVFVKKWISATETCVFIEVILMVLSVDACRSICFRRFRLGGCDSLTLLP